MTSFARLLGIALLTTLVLTVGCQGQENAPALSTAEKIVERAIVQHGGNVLDRAVIAFDFRDAHFRIRRDSGRFRYVRTYTDSLDRSVREVLSNDSLYRVVDGARADLTEDDRSDLREAVNSVVYFALVPYFLQDPAVQLEYGGLDTIQGTPYNRIRATFQQAGGGPDWEDVFVYWFKQRSASMDYLAYAYGRGPDEDYGTRFREAYNVRVVRGVPFADYRNYTTPGDSLRNLARYPVIMARDSLELVSRIELDSIRVQPLES